MYNFKNDYSEGAHPKILERLSQTNLQQQEGYGDDHYSREAKELIRKKIGNSKAALFLLSGGTQTNLIAISGLLRPYETVISALTGHIYENEAGAIEATGHRIITVETPDGKLTPALIESVLPDETQRPHSVAAKLVYISNTTEVGTVYSRKELKDLYGFCQQMGFYLYLDGARLGNAIEAEGSGLTFEDVARYTDLFYIGGTKNGALLGEALVFNNPELGVDFDYLLKQHGALLAKGRVLGIQFAELFRGELYLTNARHANRMAMRIADVMKELGCNFLAEPQSNQIFPIVSREVAEQLAEKYSFYIWRELSDNKVAIRLITSWATTEESVSELIDDLETLLRE